jgi:D-alanyl-D-alanine carboxypeptidase
MNYRDPAPTTYQISRILVAGLPVVILTIVAAIGYQSLAASSSTDASPTAVTTPAHPPHDRFPVDHPGRIGEADGVVPDGVTVFDDHYPAVAKLNPMLLAALRQAATDAAGDGVEIVVNSGWRSAAYQEQLLQQAIAQYGSAAEAARWVASPSTSAHVTEDAVDLGPSEATAWLSEHGAKYGLCQIYGNEPWHYELRPDAVDHGCPPMYADPTQDPRMQR